MGLLVICAQDLTIALMILGLCGLSRWYYVFIAPFLIGMISMAAVSGNPLLLFIFNIYEIVLAGVIGGIYLVIRRSARNRIICFASVVSLACGILNPFVIHVLFRTFRIPFMVANGDSEIRSFAIGMVAVVAGLVALWRIKKSEIPLKGRCLAWLGMILGFFWMFGWTLVFFAFAFGMSHWR